MKAIITTIVLLFIPTVSSASDTCLVIGVTDGDTLTALCSEHRQIKVRLAEIDAPEKRQPFGYQSKQSLSSICYGKSAEITQTATDRYGRTIARVQCDGLDANSEQVRLGMAWVYDRYVKELHLYQIQDQAKTARSGLWIDDAPVPPWEWRKSKAK